MGFDLVQVDQKSDSLEIMRYNDLNKEVWWTGGELWKMKKKLISNCSNTQGGVFEVSPSFLRGWPYHEFET